MGRAPKTTATASVTRLRPKRPCPICKKPSTQAAYPFCSGRCADIDLGRWLNGAYAIPAREDDAGNTAISTQESDD